MLLWICTCTIHVSQRPPVQSQVTACFSQFSKTIPDPFHHMHEISVNETRQIKATTPEDNSFFFSREKKELPQAGFEHTMSCVLGRRSTS